MDAKIAAKLFSLGKDLPLKDRKELMEKAIDYVRRFDPRFNWKVLREIEKTVTIRGLNQEGQVMPLQSSLETAREEGLKKGLQKGLLAGKKEGLQTGLQKAALNMLQKSLDTALIAEVTGLSVKEIKKLRNGGG